MIVAQRVLQAMTDSGETQTQESGNVRDQTDKIREIIELQSDMEEMFNLDRDTSSEEITETVATNTTR